MVEIPTSSDQLFKQDESLFKQDEGFTNPNTK